MVATYLLDIVFLLTAAVITVPVFRAIGLGVMPGFIEADDEAQDSKSQS